MCENGNRRISNVPLRLLSKVFLSKGINRPPECVLYVPAHLYTEGHWPNNNPSSNNPALGSPAYQEVNQASPVTICTQSGVYFLHNYTLCVLLTLGCNFVETYLLPLGDVPSSMSYFFMCKAVVPCSAAHPCMRSTPGLPFHSADRWSSGQPA